MIKETRLRPASTYQRTERIELASGAPEIVAPAAEQKTTAVRHYIVKDAVCFRFQNKGIIDCNSDQRSCDYNGLNPMEVEYSAPKPEREFGEGYLIGFHFPIYNNFGHFLIDQLPIISLAAQMDHPKRLFILGVRSEFLQQRIREIIEYFFGDVFIVRFPPMSPFSIRRGHIITGISKHPNTKNPVLKELLQGKGGHDKAGTRRIFVSRHDANDRQLTNENELFELLKPHGYEKFLSKEMDFHDTADLFKSAESVIGVAGAALGNTAFTPEGTKILSIGPSHMGGYWYYDLAGLLGHKYYDFHVESGQKNTGQRASGDFTADFSKLAKAIDYFLEA